jgi:hypothetical protein
MDLLHIIQAHCGRTGLPIPTGVQSSTQAQVIQMLGLMNELPEDLMTRGAWQKNTLEASWTSTGDEDAGTIQSLATSGYMGMVKDSIQNRTTGLRITGPLSESEWQTRKAMASNGPFYQFRLRGDHLLFNPLIPVGNEIYFEYYSSYFIEERDGDGAVESVKQYFTEDTDTLVFNEAIALSWLRWKWKAEKGLEYAEDFLKYERLVATFKLLDKTPRTVDLTRHSRRPQFGFEVPEGNWDL